MAKNPPIPAPRHRQTIKHRTHKGKFKSPPTSPREQPAGSGLGNNDQPAVDQIIPPAGYPGDTWQA